MLTLTFDQLLSTSIPKRLPVYAVSPVDSPAREIETIARAWPGFAPMQSKSTRQVNDWIYCDYGQLRLFYQRLSGALEASVRPTGTRTRTGSVKFPIDDDSAVKIARTFLGNGWFVEDDSNRLMLGKVTHLQRQHGSSEGVGPIEILDAGVVLTRAIDDTPVVGPGGHVMVNILSDGAISGASRVFRRRGARVDIVRIKPADAALAEFEQRLRRDRRLDGPVRVVSAQFGYFEAGRGHRQLFFEPAYTFVYVTELQESVMSVEVIQASGSNRGHLSGVSPL